MTCSLDGNGCRIQKPIDMTFLSCTAFSLGPESFFLFQNLVFDVAIEGAARLAKDIARAENREQYRE